MRHAHRSYLPGLIFMLLLLLLLTLLAPQAAAQGDEVPADEQCPEGLVYVEAEDMCLLPEESGEGEPVEDGTDDGDLGGEGEMTDDATENPAEGAPAIAPNETGTIRNLTLITFVCPINWNPATRDIEASREMCTEPIVPNLNYTVLFGGVEMVTAGFRTDVNLAEDLGLNGVPLPAGMWTIRENLQEGLEDPFAFCAIYAADGTSRLTVMETVPGGSLDILLAEGEEVNCEWYSVATVPEVTGDPDVLPIAGLTLDGYSCPYGYGDSSNLEHLIAACTAKGLATIEYTASLGGAVVSTQVGATDTPGVDFQAGIPTRLLSGNWTLAATLPPEYAESMMFCSVTTAAGTTTQLEPETLFDFVELELHPDDTGNCQWFNVESEPRSGPSLGISLLLHTCPEGFPLVGGDYQTCTLPLQDFITFEFIRNGQVVQTADAVQFGGVAGDPALEVRYFANDGLPEAGEWTIRPIVPPNRIEPGWACWGVDSAGAKVLGIDYFPPTDGGNGITAKIGPNLLLQCDVWFYADDLNGFVQVTASTCPDGFDAANPAAGDRNATCTKDRFVGFTYTVDDVAAGEGETDNNGLAITPRQPGQWRITAAPAAGLGVTFVTCDLTIAALNQVQTIEPTINADRPSITLDLDEGDSLRCDFFFGPMAATAEEPAAAEEPTEGEASTNTETEEPTDIEAEEPTDSEAEEPTEGGDTFGAGSDAPEDENGTGEEPDTAAVQTSSLSIQHYDCETPIIDAIVDDLVETCTASLEPSAWELNGEPFDVGDGDVVWDGLEPGTVSIGNIAADGKDDTSSAVYCNIAPADGVFIVGVETPVKDGAVELVFDETAIVYCAWFVAP